MTKLISIIIPAYNEEANIPLISDEIIRVFKPLGDRYDYEIIFVNDGSDDDSIRILQNLNSSNNKIKYIEFSRNFGKESATSSGIHYSKGDAVLMIDADLQHPPELIPEFLEKWQNGADIVIGIRKKNKGEGFVKKFGSILFYKIMGVISETEFVPNAVDYRLIDKKVVIEFNRLSEKNRITRGIIDWLGFRRSYVSFEANERKSGEAGYSFKKLYQLAFSALVSHSLFPLKLGGYLGIIITVFSITLGSFVLVEDVMMGDPLGIEVSGTAMLAIMIMFLVGIVLICLGLMAYYIANIQKEVTNRPLYVIREKRI